MDGFVHAGSEAETFSRTTRGKQNETCNVSVTVGERQKLQELQEFSCFPLLPFHVRTVCTQVRKSFLVTGERD
jgi:hypothetical protein